MKIVKFVAVAVALLGLASCAKSTVPDAAPIPTTSYAAPQK
jgi:hypothetical protein